MNETVVFGFYRRKVVTSELAYNNTFKEDLHDPKHNFVNINVSDTLTNSEHALICTHDHINKPDYNLNF